MKESDKPYPGLRGKASGVKGVDDRLYYMTGNGRIAATFYRGNIYEIFGPPYSSPSLFSSYFENEIECEDPVRTERAPVWTVSLKDQDGNCGSVTDFVDPEHPALFRSFEWNEKAPIKYLLKLKNGAFEYIIPHTEPGTLLLKTKCGNYVYNDYPLPFPQFFILSARGNASFTVCDNETIEIIISGKSLIVLNGGPDYPDACNNYKIIRDIPEDEVLRRLNDSWSEVFSRVTCLKEIPEPLPRRDELIRAVEDAVICILVQQGKEGGVLAGHAYHLGYVRDQFGVSEGLISLGLVK
ncbi:MAG: hypothetical protein J5950_07190 [Clostridia bacterium]|nr:hypothetical protein [Clostridia bacterium]